MKVRITGHLAGGWWEGDEWRDYGRPGDVMDVTDDHGAHMCAQGNAVPVAQDTEPPVEYRDDPPGATPQVPGFRDPKQAWVDHAIAQGADPAEAAAMSRNALVETYRTTPKR